MKKIVIAVVLFFLCAPVYSSVTTADGLITLDYYEDTQSGIENRWILDFSVNDIGQGIDSVRFDLKLYNTQIDFVNAYNPSSSYYVIGYYEVSTMPVVYIPSIGTDTYQLATPINTDFSLYSLTNFSGDALIGSFFVSLGYTDNMGVKKGENFYLQGPIGPAVPEPIGMVLFALGAFLMKFLMK
ncbi:MAG: hypothetical protein AB1454_07665 [Candidatus Auribacterota bacterium]